MAFAILGITDERTTCECCGRTGLNRTVALDRLDGDGNKTGDVVYFGTDCAGMAVHGRKTASNTRKVANTAAAADHLRATERRSKLMRVAGDKQTANRWYAQTRRPLDGSHFAFRGAEVVRVDGNDTADVAFWTAEGFSK